jgi:uncharacterized membrane protein YedE/YeeE
MTEFTPLSALVGGALIGLSASLLMLLTGRIAGISGILGGCLIASAGDRDWRLAFIAGLIAAPLLGALLNAPLELPRMPDNWFLIAVAGFLVGFGARMGGGCTSGHGVCGIARLSGRSLVATAVFMSAGFVAVFLMRHVFGG